MNILFRFDVYGTFYVNRRIFVRILLPLDYVVFVYIYSVVYCLCSIVYMFKHVFWLFCATNVLKVTSFGRRKLTNLITNRRSVD